MVVIEVVRVVEKVCYGGDGGG
jgi:hypothetical protein